VPKETLRALWCILFPRRCFFCNAVTAVEDRLCRECAAVPEEEYVVAEPRCKHCGAAQKSCPCGGKAMFFSDVLSPYYYVQPAFSAVRQFKFHGKREKAAQMAEDMAKRILDCFPDRPFDCICYVPQTEDEMRKRGYNQSQLLAQELSEQTGIPSCDALVKLYDTKRQQTLSSTARSGNVLGVFDVRRPGAVFEKNVLLVDDIKTTGTTLNECAKMLRIYGANTVIAAVFALTKKEEPRA
jgi:ComF family protein